MPVSTLDIGPALRTARCAIKSAARTEGEGRTACQTSGSKSPGHNCRRLLSYVWLFYHWPVLIGLRKPKWWPEIEEQVPQHEISSHHWHLSPPYFPPKSSTQSAGPPPETHKRRFFIDQNSDHCLEGLKTYSESVSALFLVDFGLQKPAK